MYESVNKSVGFLPFLEPPPRLTPASFGAAIESKDDTLVVFKQPNNVRVPAVVDFIDVVVSS